MKYFIGNWKMFGVPKSVSILNKINSYYSKDKNKNKYRVIITPPINGTYGIFFSTKYIIPTATIVAIIKGGMATVRLFPLL